MNIVDGSKSSWRTPLVVILCAGVVLSLNMGIRQTFGLFITPMNESIGISVGSFSLAVAVQNLLWGLATPIMAAMSDRFGTARMLVGGGLLYAVGLATMAFMGNEAGVHFGGGILVGMAVAACGFPMVLGAVARLTPPETRARALGFASAGGSAGQFVLLPFTQQLIGSLEWFGALLVLAALALLIVPMAAALKGRAGSHQAEHGPSSLKAAISEAGRHRGYQLLTIGFFVCGFHVAFVATHLPGYLLTCNLTGMIGATALGLIGFFNIIGGLLAGVLGGKYRKKNLLSGIYLARAVVIALFILGPKTEIAVWLFSASFGLLWLSTVPLTGGVVSDIFGSRYMSTLFGLVMLSHQIGAFLGAWLGGISFDFYGSYEPVWWISVGLGVFAALIHFPISDKALQRQPAPATGI
ncbi:MFS transporter [Limibacillus halophilus]|uniref:Putative MFS family arabinose efflux permease n=1 Tax=Limibacillus halophilus TaxID=1579333 RepID=A0A839STK9_9PROT|nr:MFS transporter [Limibacillus halophilus]MBB3064726.1 putative MFS family arabinose efflux permease [Limibacillus halophilus]